MYNENALLSLAESILLIYAPYGVTPDGVKVLAKAAVEDWKDSLKIVGLSKEPYDKYDSQFN